MSTTTAGAGTRFQGDAAGLLRRYVRDHWAAAGGGVTLADRLYRENTDTPWANQLDRLQRDIRSDDAALRTMCRALGSRSGRVRRFGAVTAAHVGRLKLNGRLWGYSPLSRVFEAESLMSGVLAKQRLWVTLEAVLGVQHAEADFAVLVRRAEAQLTTLTGFHDWALRQAFAGAVEAGDVEAGDGRGGSDTGTRSGVPAADEMWVAGPSAVEGQTQLDGQPLVEGGEPGGVARTEQIAEPASDAGQVGGRSSS